MSNKSGPLMLYDAARRALVEAHSVDEVKAIHDKAAAVQEYARRAKDTEMITKATEIRMQAERRAGELLREMEKNQGAVPGKTGSKGKPVLDNKPKLADFGINKTQSSRWQKLAALPEDQFKAKIESASKRAYDGIAQRFIKGEEIRHAKKRHTELNEHGCTV